MTRLGGIIPDISQNGTLDLGEIDRNWTQSRSLGGSVQAVDTDKIFGHDNTLTVGASLDYGWTHFTGNSQLGTFEIRQQHVVPGDRLPLHSRRARQLSCAGRGQCDQPLRRPLRARHVQRDRPPDADRRRAFQFRGDQSRGRERRSRSTATRPSSTSIRLSASPTRSRPTSTSTRAMRCPIARRRRSSSVAPIRTHPCIIDNFLVSDPKLQQVVGQTFEAGFRGQNDFGQYGQAAMVGGSLPHDARQRHPAAAEPC